MKYTPFKAFVMGIWNGIGLLCGMVLILRHIGLENQDHPQGPFFLILGIVLVIFNVSYTVHTINTKL